MFVHLHNHSDYSLLDGACRIPELVKIAVEQGAPAVGLTDHGNMFGALDFYTTAREAGIKPIVGCELYMAPKSRLEKQPGRGGEMRYHQVLLAKNLTGYRNLCKLCSEAYLTGFYYKPRIDQELLQEYHEGLICLSSCLQGEIPQLVLGNDPDGAFESVKFFRGLFGDDFYLELMRHNIPEQDELIPHLAQFAEDLDIKLVATNDAHYLKREHAAAHDILLCVGTQSQRDDPNRMKFPGEEFYLKTQEEMADLFAEFPEALANTIEIADKVDLEIPLDKRHFPVFKLPDEPGLDADKLLERLSREGIVQRFDGNLPEGAEERLKSELDVIRQTGFADYFLIVADFVSWAKDQGVPVGPGRGSAAGCLVSYCLGITNLDPIGYDLLFERFLNLERLSPPDIDIDFSDDRREEVISYVRDQYGHDNVCRITTFGRMAARSAVRDVARAMGLTYAEGDRIAKLIPEGGREITLDRAIAEVPELKALTNSDSRFQELVELTRLVEGAVRHASTHAAGVVVCPGKTIDFLPVYKQANDDEVYTQYDMNWMDPVGLLKMDFLGLQTLQELDLTVKSLRRKGIDVDFDDLDLDDKEVFRLFGDGNTIGVFQFESAGMRENLVKLKPSRLEDLIAMNALYRPGPMKMIDEYIACRHGRKKVEYRHPKLEPILETTYGVIVYQEQVMRIATDLAGFSLGKADNLRWAMGKKKMKLMQSLQVEFIEGCVANGIDQKTATSIYHSCEQFAKYGFVKAHSAGYALIAYQCAYLKTHYPADFLAACLTVRSKYAPQVMKLLSECRSLGIRVLQPDINESQLGFTANNEGIRFGLAAIKNVGEAAVKEIVGAREEAGQFTSLIHFLESVDLRSANKKVIESMIAGGAFDQLGNNRATLLASLPGAIAYAQAIQEERLRGQTTIFGSSGDSGGLSLPPPELRFIEEWDDSELQSREKEVLGYYITSHPLSSFTREIEGLASHQLGEKDDFHNKTAARVFGVLTSVKIQMTRKGKPMVMVTLEDLSGTIECRAMQKSYEAFIEHVTQDNIVGLAGTVSRDDSGAEPFIWMDDAFPIEEAADKWGKAVGLYLDKELISQPFLDRLIQAFESNPGTCPLYINLSLPDGGSRKLRIDRFKVKPAPPLLDRLTELVGNGKVRLSA